MSVTSLLAVSVTLMLCVAACGAEGGIVPVAREISDAEVIQLASEAAGRDLTDWFRSKWQMSPH